MFKFRLAKFLYFKSLEEKNCLRDLNTVRSKREALRMQAGEIQDQIRQSRVSFHEKVAGNRGSGYIAGMQGAFEQSALAAITKKHNEAERLAALEESYRQKYEAAWKKRKVLENLKERRYEQYLEEQKREQDRFYDEVLVNNYSANKKSNAPDS